MAVTFGTNPLGNPSNNVGATCRAKWRLGDSTGAGGTASVDNPTLLANFAPIAPAVSVPELAADLNRVYPSQSAARDVFTNSTRWSLSNLLRSGGGAAVPTLADVDVNIDGGGKVILTGNFPPNVLGGSDNIIELEFHHSATR